MITLLRAVTMAVAVSLSACGGGDEEQPVSGVRAYPHQDKCPAPEDGDCDNEKTPTQEGNTP